MASVNLTQLYEDVSRFGFHVTDELLEISVECLGGVLGDPVPSGPGRKAADLLVPRTSDGAHVRTLSRLHGLGAFPFHTETAHWRRPVDLVILKCLHPGAGDRPTTLIDGWRLGLSDRDADDLRSSIMVVRNGARSFLAPLASKTNNHLAFRHDPGCMRPASKHDKGTLELLQERLSSTAPTAVHWKAGRCLIFDNSRVFHSRGRTSIPDTDRRLQRLYVSLPRK